MIGAFIVAGGSGKEKPSLPKRTRRQQSKRYMDVMGYWVIYSYNISYVAVLY